MSDTPFFARLWLKPDPASLAPLAKVAVYGVLIFWTIVVVGPLYWVLITSFKLAIDVDNDPFYFPFIDFKPSLDAWHYLFVDVGNDTIRPYINSVIVAFFATFAAVIIGSFAAYALVRIQFQVKTATILTFLGLLVTVVVAVAALHIYWGLAVIVVIALFLIFLSTAASRFKRGVGIHDIEFWIISNRIMPPIVAVLPIYLMFQQVHLLDTHIALIATYTAVNLPRGLADARFLRRHSDRDRGERPGRRLRQVSHLLHHRPAARPLGPRRNVHARPHPLLERVPAGALPLQRQCPDHANPGFCSERHARAAVAVHVGAHRYHGGAGRRHCGGAAEAHRPRHSARSCQGLISAGRRLPLGSPSSWSLAGFPHYGKT
jgi:ABC-type glycerol-3-phosphate transport system permease component